MHNTQNIIKKAKMENHFCQKCHLVCKPSSVLDGHLSRLVVTNKFKRYCCFRVKERTFAKDLTLHRVGFTEQ